MPTTNERREVAARLRECVAMRYRYNCQNPDLLGCLVANLTKPHCGESTVVNVLSRLADLIEPEERNCRRIEGVPFPRCSECGAIMGLAFNFCPNCGARVKGEE